MPIKDPLKSFKYENGRIREVDPPKYYSDVSNNLSAWQSPDNVNDGPARPLAPGFVLQFVHIATGEAVNFKAFLTAYEDGYESQWNEKEVFGRMDPISTFKRTRRRIRLGWDIPSASEEEAIHNLENSEKLLSMLYPVYEETTIGEANPLLNPLGTGVRKVNTMVAPPLFKLKFANLIMDAESGTPNSTAREGGLVGTISGLVYRPDIEQGFFGPFHGNIADGGLVPQTISFDLEFVVHHTHGLGWKRNRRVKNDADKQGTSDRPERRTSGFPYAGKKILG